ncbi:peptidoglycan-binding protein [Oceanobacillus sp. FSL H7-0719]|uniref:peptidoglycan-binding protein n=1 Tax=Oceanobacillus sp. FSL H7-0719 TaxID=2954507 RepID=UPI00324B82C0
MRFLKFIFVAIFFFGSLHFSFGDVQAAENDEADAVTEETEQTPKKDISEQEVDSESTENIHTSEGETQSVEKDTDTEVDEAEIQPENNPEESEEPAEAEEKETDSDESEQDDSKAKKMTTFSAKVATMPYKENDRHEDLIEIKKKLNAIGFGGISETDFFGSWTKTRVEQFQEYYGLPVTGEINKATSNKIDSVFNSPFQLGERHESTIELKEKLNSLGYGHISVTDLYGSWTVNRVQKFQKENGLRVNGIADEPTWEKLNELASQTEFKVGDRHPNIISIKQKLNAVGFDGISETDYYGAWTKTRVTQFQAYYGLTQTGTTNKATLDNLNELYTSPFQLGKRHKSTIELKEKLNSLGYGHISVTDLYGSWTVNRVKKFQEENGLRVNGIADAPTWAKLDQLLSTTEFKVGDRHPNIVSIKQKLNALGFDGISETDYYGSWTKTRVIEFQEYYGLSQTGTTNKATIDKLNEIYNSPFQLGKRHESNIEFKEKLNQIGYGHISISNLYGSWMENRVKKFQKDHGLKDHGILDEPTQAKINSEVNKSEFKLGDTHQRLIGYKEQLNKIGFGYITVTDYYGSWTENRVRKFQDYYSISKNGQLDKATISKLDEVYNSPYQSGKSHPDLIEIKEMLNSLGYGNITVTENYGSWMENRVRKFQRDYNLVENGIVDQVTLQKIYDLFEIVERFDIRLTDALKMQMAANPQTDKYRNDPAYISSGSSYVNIGQKGLTISGANVNLRTKADTTSSVNDTVGPNTTVVILGTVKGSNYKGSTEWYKVWYNNKQSYTHSSLVNEKDTQMAVVKSKNLNVRADATTNSHKFGSFSKGTVLEIIGYKGTWLQVPYGAWRSATELDTLEYLDPSNEDVDMFQHLDLSSPAGATAAELNKYLKGKGVLEGTGQAFIDAANLHHINELYLVSHALLETAHGESNLAKGIVVNGKKVHNMFGIGAYDNCPDTCGSQRAYEEGWDSPYKAIVGGATFIGQKYIHNEYNQNTLYKMRWNPEGMARHGYATHQYATDVGWAKKQLSSLKKLHQEIIANPVLKFNVVQYK